jgi:hypothetical protein
MSTGSSEWKEGRIFTAILALVVAVVAVNSTPLSAQVSTGTQNGSCVEAKLTLPAPLGQVDDEGILASALPPLTTFFVEADTQTLTGRLTCADPRPAFYNCGHTKQSVWGCKPDCFMDRDGSQYVLQSPGKSYSVTGDSNQIRRFLADQVTVTGELKGDTIKAISIAKASKKERTSGMRSENGTP